ncbi:hypothetical protein AAHU49_26235 (plasmid) [Klebsiella quasipneumoniae subsp. quasipneumoniae]|uniref:hypothetical protein n=1 Tax=Klebsiella quasipneumoniae TaxID=1463165 RepID=UPI00359F910C
MNSFLHQASFATGYWCYDRHRSVRLVVLVGLANDQIAQSGLSSLSVIYYSAQLFSGTSDGLKVFFDSWGFSPFGLIESHVMQEHWSLVHVGGRASVNGDKIDYSFVDNQPQAGDGYQPKTGVFLYGCMTSDKRPSWVEKIYSRTGMFRGGIEG